MYEFPLETLIYGLAIGTPLKHHNPGPTAAHIKGVKVGHTQGPIYIM